MPVENCRNRGVTDAMFSMFFVTSADVLDYADP